MKQQHVSILFVSNEWSLLVESNCRTKVVVTKRGVYQALSWYANIGLGLLVKITSYDTSMKANMINPILETTVNEMEGTKFFVEMCFDE